MRHNGENRIRHNNDDIAIRIKGNSPAKNSKDEHMSCSVQCFHYSVPLPLADGTADGLSGCGGRKISYCGLAFRGLSRIPDACGDQGPP
jgi:hypothetical protein